MDMLSLLTCDLLASSNTNKIREPVLYKVRSCNCSSLLAHIFILYKYKNVNHLSTVKFLPIYCHSGAASLPLRMTIPCTRPISLRSKAATESSLSTYSLFSVTLGYDINSVRFSLMFVLFSLTYEKNSAALEPSSIASSSDTGQLKHKTAFTQISKHASKTRYSQSSTTPRIVPKLLLLHPT